MKNERILLADDYDLIRQGIAKVIEKHGKNDGHKVVGQASSTREVEKLLDKGLKPTVALVDGSFPKPGDGELAAQIIRKFSPETLIISFSNKTQTWGDYNWKKRLALSEKEFVEALTDLQH